MSLIDTINADIKAAMLAREKEKLEALRAVKSALLLLAAEAGKQPISEDDERKLLQKLVRQRKETAVIYHEQQREDLAAPELFQAGVIAAYLPAQLDPEEVKIQLEHIIRECGAQSIKDMGKVMAAASAALAGKADNKTIAALVRELLPT